MQLSSIVLTKNEEKNIERCIKALSFCDEIIVIDDYSVDKTVEIAKKLNATVIQRPLNNNFSAQRNCGLAQANGEWVLFVDADEIVSEGLKSEILSNINSKFFKGFYLRRKDLAFGRELKFGETANVKLLRLGRKDSGLWQRPVHEVWKIKGPVDILKTPLSHFSHHNIIDSLRKINYYSTIEANFRKNEKSGYIKIFFYPAGKFIKNFIFSLGILDGMQGFLIASLMSAHSFLVRVKIWENQNSVAEKYL
jgi:glycosyltransferase involved in cell wall biosynthesis